MNNSEEKMLLETIEVNTKKAKTSNNEMALLQKIADIGFFEILKENNVLKVYGLLDFDLYFKSYYEFEQLSDEVEKNGDENCIALINEFQEILDGFSMFKNQTLDADLKEALEYSKAMNLIDFKYSNNCLFLYSSATLDDVEFESCLCFLLAKYKGKHSLYLNLMFLFSAAMEDEDLETEADFVVPFSEISENEFKALFSFRFYENLKGFIDHRAYANHFYITIEDEELKYAMQKQGCTYDCDEHTKELLQSLPLKAVGGCMIMQSHSLN
jgi:hypothetical protein